MKIARGELDQLILEELQLMVESGEIDEGFLDRMRARGAGAVTGLKSQAGGLGQRAAGTFKGAVAGATGDVAGVEAATAQRAAGKEQQAGAGAKADAMKKWKLMQTHFNDITADLRKMGINPDQTGIRSALHGLERAVYGTLKQQSGADIGSGKAMEAPAGGAPAGEKRFQTQTRRTTGSPSIPGVTQKAAQQEGKRRKVKKRRKTTRRKV